MASPPVSVDALSAEERIELIGRLWDSLDPSTAAPITGELVTELDRREAEADAASEAGETWAEIQVALLRKLR